MDKDRMFQPERPSTVTWTVFVLVVTVIITLYASLYSSLCVHFFPFSFLFPSFLSHFSPCTSVPLASTSHLPLPERSVQLQPEYTLPYAVYLLAHHPKLNRLDYYCLDSFKE